MKWLARHLLNSAAILVTTLMLVSAGLAQIMVTDISPDLPFGVCDPTFGPCFSTTGGRLEGLAIDPSNDSVLYAASEWAGVWKTTDGAHTWTQSGNGLRSGISVPWYNGGASIAVDSVNSQRLLYAEEDKDARTSASLGGLWVSIDGAANWSHVTLPGCFGYGKVALQNVVFAGGTPYALTATPGCELWTSSDPKLQSWYALPEPPFFSAPYNSFLLTAPRSSSTVFGCSGTSSFVFRNVNAAGGGAWDSVQLPSPCVGLSAVPALPGAADSTQALVLVVFNNQLVVVIADFSTGTTTSLPPVGPSGGSGTISVWAAPFHNPHNQGPGLSYDVFVGDGAFFRYYDVFSNRWYQVSGSSIGSGVHIDTGVMAFPSTYDRVNGNCDAYLTNDGGVFANQVTEQQGAGGCTILGATVDWMSANHGLHVIEGNGLTGVSHNYYPSISCPIPNLTTCPTLYLATTDNNVWGVNDGGFSGLPWQGLGFELGDGAEVWIDSIHPNAALGIRNGNAWMHGSNLIPQQPPFNPLPGLGNFFPPFGFEGVHASTENGILQVMTVPTDSPFVVYDYVGIGSTCDTCPELVLRLISPFALPAAPGNWTSLTRLPLASFFGNGQIGTLAASGGHDKLIVYVLTSNGASYDPSGVLGPGQVWRGAVGPDGLIHSWTQASGSSTAPLGQAYNLLVNPYNPNELYATDLVSRSIKVSRDGGQSWYTDAALTSIASNHGEFLISCGAFGAFGPDGFGDKEIFGSHCSLGGIAFDFSDPNARVAALYPGGVAFSRDAGKHWIALDVTNNRVSTANSPIDLPSTALYDPAPNPNTGYPSIYLALEGRGVKRLDGPFPTLGSAQAICTICSQTLPATGWVIVNSLQIRVPLQRDSDGVYRANVPFNMANVKTLSYYFLMDGQTSLRFTHTISAAERRSGTLILSDVGGADD